ncbi:MAG: PAS domain S-box protein [Magnetococcales bacterium]|nr:PAS domain S-box protein [Magnetococcales bacterium]
MNALFATDAISSPRALLVGGDVPFWAPLREALSDCKGFHLHGPYQLSEQEELALAYAPHLILLAVNDNQLPDLTCLERLLVGGASLVVVSHGNRPEMRPVLFSKGVVDWLVLDALPDPLELMARLNHHGQLAGMVRDKQLEQRKFEALRRLRRAIQAGQDCTVDRLQADCEQVLYQSACEMLVERIGFRLAWVGLAEESPGHPVRPVAQAGYEDAYLGTLNLTWDDTPRGRGPTGFAIRTGRPAMAQNIINDPTFGPWRQEALKRGYASSLALPLRVGEGRVTGALNLYADEPDAFDSEEVWLLEQMANQLALGATNMRVRAERNRMALDWKSSQDALQESRSMLQAILDYSPEVIFLKNVEGRYLLINKRHEALFHISRSEISGKTDFDSFPEEVARKLIANDQLVRTQGSPIQVEEQVPHDDGEMHTYIVSKFPLLDDANQVYAICGIATDITDRKRAEAKLQESEERYRALVELSQEAILVNSKDVIIFANPACARLLKAPTPDALVGMSVNDIIHPDYVNSIRRRARSVMERGEVAPLMEQQLVAMDGSILEVESIGGLIRYSGREAVQVVMRDITERKRAQEALHLARYSLENMRDAAYWITREGAVFDANRAALQALGYARDELLSLRVSDIFSESPKGGRWDQKWLEIAEAGAIKVTTIQRCKNGDDIPVVLSINHVTLGDRELHFVSAIDITEQRRLEAAMIQAKREAEAANQAKSAFLATMSHEIRTPLNAILGIGEVILEGPLDQEQRSYMETVDKAGKSLLSLINDVLDISKIEAGEMELELSAFNLRHEVTEALKIVRPEVGEKALRLVMDADSGVPDWVMGDPGRLRQILINLIHNAVKFTEKGRVTVHVQPLLPPLVQFEVSDTGIGIPEEKLQSIFSSFSQADASNTRCYGGVGLGLAICRRLVEHMGGEIEVVSREGQGAMFRFAISLESVETPEGDTVSHGGHEGSRLDTVARNDLGVSTLLAERGVSNERRHESRCRRAAERRQDSRRIGQRRRVIRRGDDSLQLGPHQQNGIHKRVLVAEDSSDNRLLIRAFLKKFPVELVMAENGAEAVALFEKELFHLVLMDLQMPVMDGYEATRRIRIHEAKHPQRHKQAIPIVVLTAHAIREVSHKARMAGCDFFLTKPISKKRLLETLQNFADIANVKVQD